MSAEELNSTLAQHVAHIQNNIRLQGKKMRKQNTKLLKLYFALGMAQEQLNMHNMFFSQEKKEEC